MAAEEARAVPAEHSGKGLSHATMANTPSGTVITSPRGDTPIDQATEAARRVIDALLRTNRDDANLARVAAELDAIADHLEEHAGPVQERLVDMWSGEGVTRHDPVTGPENAVAPPLVLRGYDDASVRGEVALTIPYQGPPGCVHGGVSALLLDHVLGVANAWSGKDGMTAQLNVRYHRPAPLFETLEVSGRQERTEGRKIWTTGQISHNGEVCVSVEGLFINKKVPRPT